MNTLMNVIIFILFAYYLAALAERLTKPEIIELVDGEPQSMGYDNYYEIEYLNTRDYYTAADHGFGHESDWDF